MKSEYPAQYDVALSEAVSKQLERHVLIGETKITDKSMWYQKRYLIWNGKIAQKLKTRYRAKWDEETVAELVEELR